MYIMGRRQTALDQAAKAIGNQVTAFQGDVANAEDLDHLYAVIKKEKGSLDVVVANAGVPPQDERERRDGKIRTVNSIKK